jgi:hypothetical protein
LACIISSAVFSQHDLDLITEKDSREILEFLASERLKGRVNFSSGQIRAAEFIGQHFEQYGLKTFLKAKGFYHPFTLTNNLDKIATPNIVQWNGKKLSPRQFYYSNPLPEVLPMQLSDFRIIKLDQLFRRDSMEVFINDDMPLLVWGLSKDVESGYHGMIQRMKEVRHKRVLLVFDPSTPETLSVNADASSVSRVLYNVAGVLPGTSKAGEIVIISAHYDHVSEDASGRRGLYNGANDNASGVPAHTIMCSADDDPCYHQECDDAETIDYTNMTNIIKGIAQGIRTVVKGRDTPRLSR